MDVLWRATTASVIGDRREMCCIVFRIMVCVACVGRREKTLSGGGMQGGGSTQGSRVVRGMPLVVHAASSVKDTAVTSYGGLCVKASHHHAMQRY